MDFRKYFGLSRKSNSIEAGIHLSDYKFTVPGDTVNRVGLHSSGLGLHLRTRIPTAPSYAWLLGGEFIPHLSHTETATNLNLQSGTNPQSSKIALNLGGELALSRQNQIVWNLSLGMEKDQFGGASSLPDPETGVAPQGVSVTNSFTVFSFGYRWGQ